MPHLRVVPTLIRVTLVLVILANASSAVALLMCSVMFPIVSIVSMVVCVVVLWDTFRRPLGG